ncbi:hypothetical protein SAMN05443247_06519 [Bradyrhizobium erythrophlei]|nr:hypothetical protein SAMN05443247_06519 [Bradyrhizobium erythrophlei]
MQVSRHPKIPEGSRLLSPPACAQWVVVREVQNNAHSQRGFRRVQLPCFVNLGNLRWHFLTGETNVKAICPSYRLSAFRLRSFF